MFFIYSSYYRRNSPKWYLCWQPVVKNNKKCSCWGTSVMSNLITIWTVVCQAPLFMELSRQEYQSGLPCPPPGDLPNPEIKPMSITSPALASRFFTTSNTWEVVTHTHIHTHTHTYTHMHIYDFLCSKFQPLLKENIGILWAVMTYYFTKIFSQFSEIINTYDAFHFRFFKSFFLYYWQLPPLTK